MDYSLSVDGDSKVHLDQVQSSTIIQRLTFDHTCKHFNPTSLAYPSIVPKSGSGYMRKLLVQSHFHV